MTDIRAPSDKELAEKDYLLGMKYKDIAEKYGVTLNTVKSWKKRYGWNRKGVHTKKEEGAHKEIKKSSPGEPAEKLTEKQKLFCLYYIKNFNATSAAIKAGYAPDSAHVTGHDLLRNPKIAAEIRRLKGSMTEDLYIDAMDVLNRYIKIAFADMNDFVEIGQEEVPVIGQFGPVEIKDPATGEKKILKQKVNVIRFKSSDQVDGGLICEVSEGRNGTKIKLEDRQKALDKLAEYFDLFPDKFKRQIEEQKLEIARIKAGNIEETETEDDGFIEALRAAAKDVWSDENGKQD